MFIRDEPTCWSTPISFARSVVLAALTDEGALSISFKTQTETGTSLVCFEFREPRSYQIERGPTRYLRRPSAKLGNSLICKSLPPPQESGLINTNAISKYMLEDDWQIGYRFIFVARDCHVIVDSIGVPSIRTIATQRRKSA